MAEVLYITEPTFLTECKTTTYSARSTTIVSTPPPEEIRPLNEPAAAPVTSEARVREIVRDELGGSISNKSTEPES